MMSDNYGGIVYRVLGMNVTKHITLAASQELEPENGFAITR